MRASLSESSGRARSFQAVEDQVQAEAELVARLQDAFNRELGEVRILAGRELIHDRLGEDGGFVGCFERKPGLLQREAVDLAVERGERVCGQLD